MVDKEPDKKMVESGPWWGWQCTSCGYQFKGNYSCCPWCNHTVYKPIRKDERK